MSLHPTNWSAAYWKNEQHGTAWDRVKEALQRDWEQTRVDLGSGGKELNQEISDTVKQATGNEPIPPVSVPNPQPRVAETHASWADAETALRYGVGARHQYNTMPRIWDPALETKLASEWDDERTGKSFAAVRPWVRHGWEYLS